MYDPQVARFLSPDPYIQDGGNWLNYNRYAYCLNNPLVYTDPSGELHWIPIVAAIVMSGMQAGGNAIYNGGDFWEGAIQGAVIGAVTAGIGIGASYLAASITSAIPMNGFAESLVHGGLGYLSSGAISYIATGKWDWNAALIGGVTAFAIKTIQFFDENLTVPDYSNTSTNSNSSGYLNLNDVKNEAKKLGIEEGKYGLGKITLQAANSRGMYLDYRTKGFYQYENGQKIPVLGFVHRSFFGMETTMHISPKATLHPNLLELVLRHEGTHMYHYYFRLDKTMSRDDFHIRTENGAYTDSWKYIKSLPPNIRPAFQSWYHEILKYLNNNFNIWDPRFAPPSFPLP
jgi:hypothetical protein